MAGVWSSHGLKQKQQHKNAPSRRKRILLDELKLCSSTRNLQRGKQIHLQAVESGAASCVYFATALVKMYSRCSRMDEALRVFDRMQQPDVVSWTALILGYADNGQGDLALSLLQKMDSQGCAPDSFTFAAALKACISLVEGKNGSRKVECLAWGRKIHSQIGCHLDTYVQNSLITMYSKCSCMAEAQQVFEGMKQPDVVSWNTLILGYAENGEGVIALSLFAKMTSQGCCAPDSVTFVAALKACICLAAAGTRIEQCLKWGKEIHAQISCGCRSYEYVESALIKMYAKCGSMKDARQTFDSSRQPSLMAWTSLILGYADNGEAHTALDMFARMRAQGYVPDALTFVAVLKACMSLAPKECLERGKGIHSLIGNHSDFMVQTTLITMYAQCASMVDARQVFDSIKCPDVVSWTALISGYAENGEGVIALDLFSSMKSAGCAPDSLTFVAALKACTGLAADGRPDCLEQGRAIHAQIGCHLCTRVENTLVSMYANCGSMVEAQRTFNGMKHSDVVSWNALILGYAENGQGVTALDEFSRMISQGAAPNSLTFVAALKACAILALEPNESKAQCLERGREIHSRVGGHSDMYVQNTLINMYSKCGSMIEARQVFDTMVAPNLVSWNSLISGYVENGEGAIALNLFERLESRGCLPDSLTFASAIKACGLLGALECGRRIHGEAVYSSAEPDRILVTSLVDFYSKCGDMAAARKVFEAHSGGTRLYSWTALLAGYSRLGQIEAVLELVEAMKNAGFQPNEVTFLCVLMCCSHAGLVDAGKECLADMTAKHGVAPAVEHYTCLIDLVGRKGMLGDVTALLRSMPCRPNVVTWMAVLSACSKWRNAETGSLAFESVVHLDASNAAAYVLLARIFENRGMWKEHEMVLAMKQELGPWKEPAQTCWTSERGVVHAFD